MGLIASEEGQRGREGSLEDGYLSCLCVIKIFA